VDILIIGSRPFMSLEGYSESALLAHTGPGTSLWSAMIRPGKRLFVLSDLATFRVVACSGSYRRPSFARDHCAA
jgi:hypothetical protein